MQPCCPRGTTDRRIYAKPGTIARALEGRWRANTKDLRFRDGPWRYSRRLRQDYPAQGWKIHVSATVLSAGDVLARARPVLAKHDAPFKVPARLELLAALNAGLGQFSQVGKFLTVYPRNDAEAINLARELHAATHGFHGPRIPFDTRYKKNSLVFYRYGSFFAKGRNGSGGKIVDPAGRVRADVRDRAHAVPKWLKDPFTKGRIKSKRLRLADSIGMELLPFKAIAQRGKGGVYQAVDLSVSPARLVLVKEGRRHGETDWLGQDGFARTEREGRVLRDLHRCGLPVLEPIREFTERGNH